ncbi:MAG: hypothetical protein AAF251_06285 [Pseudomonadota bacterium]
MIPSPQEALTERQREVLNLLDMGESRQSIANHIGVSPSRVSQIVRGLKDHFHMPGATDVKLIQFYREAIGDVPDANDPIEGEVIANDVLDQITIPPEIDADIATGGSLVPDALNGPNGTLLRVAIIVAIPLAFGLVLALLSDAASPAKLGPEQNVTDFGLIPT